MRTTLTGRAFSFYAASKNHLSVRYMSPSPFLNYALIHPDIQIGRYLIQKGADVCPLPFSLHHTLTPPTDKHQRPRLPNTPPPRRNDRLRLPPSTTPEPTGRPSQDTAQYRGSGRNDAVAFGDGEWAWGGGGGVDRGRGGSRKGE